MAGYGNGYGNGGGNGGGQRPPPFAKGSLNFNQKKQKATQRDLNGKLKFGDGGERWLDAWINGPKDNPNAQAAIAHVLEVIAKEGLYIAINVGDVAQQQGQGGGQGNFQGGGYGQQQSNQQGYIGGAPQGQGNQGGGYGQQQPAPQGGYGQGGYQGGGQQNGGNFR
jgi:hypothetical protein